MRIQFRPYPVLTLFSLIGLVLLVFLGSWQLRRHVWKASILLQLEKAETQSFYSVTELMEKREAGENIDYYPVLMKGVCDKNRSQGPLFVYQPTAKGIGWRVLDWVFVSEPLNIMSDKGLFSNSALPNQAQGREIQNNGTSQSENTTPFLAVLVDYGLISDALIHLQKNQNSTFFQTMEKIKAELHQACPMIKGRLWPYASVNRLVPKGEGIKGRMYTVNLSYFKRSGYQFPVNKTEIFPYYLKRERDLFSEKSNADTEYSALPHPHNRHLGYAVNWFIFAVILLVFYGVYHARHGRLSLNKKNKT